MKLLSTVHWVVTREEATALEQAITKTHAWNTRKYMFDSRHIHLGWKRLHETGWLV